MNIVPDWAPNIHPMIIHFPIVLLIVAVILDITGQFLKKISLLEKSAFILYVLGTIGAAAAYLTGRAAADQLNLPANVVPVVDEHADWAQKTLWFFVSYTIIRLTTGLCFKSLKKAVMFAIAFIGVLGIYFLYETADHGSKLVFGYGLGTGNLLSSDKREMAEAPQPDSILIVGSNGSWKLQAAPGIVKILRDKFNWVDASPEELSIKFDSADSSVIISLEKTALFYYDKKNKNVQVSINLNIDKFNGDLELIHHYFDKNNYDFLGINKNELSLSRKTNDEIKVLSKKKSKFNGWIRLKIVSHGTHFRAYLGKKMLVHGHGSEPDSGAVGVKLSGRGIIGLRMIDVESIQTQD